MKQKKTSVKATFSGDEISLLDLLRLFTERKRHIYITVGIFFVIGVVIATTSPVEYKTEAQVLSESGGASSGSSLGGLSGLAGLAGIQLPSTGQGDGAGLSPDMYPTIVESSPFLLDLMKEEFFFQEKNQELSLFEYFSSSQRGHAFSKIFGFLKGIPGRFFSLFEKKDKEWSIPQSSELAEDSASESIGNKKLQIVSISNEQKFVMSELVSRIEIQAEGRIINVIVKMPEPYISAQLNNIVLQKVIEYVVAYKTEKQRQNLEFITERTKEAEEKFEKAQLRLAAFRDANQGIVTQTARTKEERLQADFSLASSIYNGLAQQLEQTKIQLKKDTPLFTEFEPVSVPLSKSEPSVPRILILYTFLGVFFGGLVIVVSIFRSYFQESAVGEIPNQADKN